MSSAWAFTSSYTPRSNANSISSTSFSRKSGRISLAKLGMRSPLALLGRARRVSASRSYPFRRCPAVRLARLLPGCKPDAFRSNDLMATFAELEQQNPNVRRQYETWRRERFDKGEDQYDYQAFRN